MMELRFLRYFRIQNALKLLSVVLGLSLVSAAFAESDLKVALTTDQKNEIASKFAGFFPQIKVIEVTETDFGGLYELMLDSGESVFVNRNADQLLVNAKHLRVTGPGQVVDVTEEKKSAGRKALISALKPEKAIIFKGEGKKTTPLYIFTDVDCGYCRKLHEEVPALQKAGIDVMYFAWPRSGMNSNTATKMHKVWCADDPQAAMTAAKSGNPLPEAKETCKSPIEEDLRAGMKLGVAGTPAIFTEDGRQIGGYAKADDLLKVIQAQ